MLQVKLWNDTMPPGRAMRDTEKESCKAGHIVSHMCDQTDWFVREAKTYQASSLMGISSLNSSLNKSGQKATESFIPNYQTPLK